MGRLAWAVLRLLRRLSAFRLYEAVALRVFRVRPVRPGGLLLYRVTRYRGAARSLAGGRVVKRGDRLVELHLDNRRLRAVRAAGRGGPWELVGLIRGDLQQLGRLLAEGRLGPAAALHGVALIGGPGARLGFESNPLPRSRRARLMRYFMVGVDAVYHPAGQHRLEGRFRRRWPVEVWMSAERAIAPSEARAREEVALFPEHRATGDSR